MSERTPRENQTRLFSERKKAWSPPSLLPTPQPRDGLAHRWIRKSILGQPDDRNMISKQDEGWTPINREDYPELQIQGKDSGSVEIGGLVLCSTPQEFVDQRNAWFRKQTDAQTAAVDANLMKENDPRMPLFSERKSTTSNSKMG
jgi:hypothetical protein